MLTGIDLGNAIRLAMRAKRVGPSALARHFGVKPESGQGWMKTGRIGKDKIDGLISYFSEVVPPSHWGLEGVAAQAMAKKGELAAGSRTPAPVRQEFLALLEKLVDIQRKEILERMRVMISVNEAVRSEKPASLLELSATGRMLADMGLQDGPLPTRRK